MSAKLSLRGLSVPTTTEEAVKAVWALEELIGGGFHCDTRGADYVTTTWAEAKGVSVPTSEPTFSEADAAKLDKIMDAVFELVADPYEVSMEAFEAFHPEAFQ